jgi:hypothetical protein
MKSYERQRRALLKRRSWNTVEERHPMLVFALLGQDDVRETQYDSTGPWHQALMASVGPIALVPFNLPLNGQSKQFENVCTGPGDFLLFHQEEPCVLEEEEKIKLEATLHKIKAAHRFLKIYATEGAAKMMPKNINWKKIQEPCKIFQEI